MSVQLLSKRPRRLWGLTLLPETPTVWTTLGSQWTEYSHSMCPVGARPRTPCWGWGDAPKAALLETASFTNNLGKSFLVPKSGKSKEAPNNTQTQAAGTCSLSDDSQPVPCRWREGPWVWPSSVSLFALWELELVGPVLWWLLFWAQMVGAEGHCWIPGALHRQRQMEHEIQGHPCLLSHSPSYWFSHSQTYDLRLGSWDLGMHQGRQGTQKQLVAKIAGFN